MSLEVGREGAAYEANSPAMTEAFPCYHLPEGMAETLSFQTLTFPTREAKPDQPDTRSTSADQNGPPPTLELKVPRFTSEELREVIRRVKQARENYLVQLRTQDIVEMIDEAVWRWLHPHYEKRRLAEEMLPLITGYDQEMIRLFLGQYLRRFRKASLWRMIDEDFPNPLVLDEFRPRKAGGLYRAYGPELITHIFSGNVPALPLWSMVAGLLLKSATLGKVSSSEPLFPVLFAQTLAEIEPRLAETMAIVWWKGGETELEQAAFRQSEAVIAYGSEETTRQIAKQIPSGVRFVEHGHKVSFGVITKECLENTKVQETARRAAHDASWFDQQGCLSPHVFFVETGGSVSPQDFAQLLAGEMEAFEHRLPRASLSAAEQQAIIQLRSQIEFQSFTGANDTDVSLYRSETGTAWTVIYRERPNAFPVSVLNRVVTVVPLETIDQLPRYLKGAGHLLQTAGICSPPQKFHRLIEILGRCGVNRICALGEMPQPEPGWHHDGRFHLGDLVRWCDVESSVELSMDEYDPYRE